MRTVFALLQDYATRIAPPTRRMLIFICAVAMTLYARTTVAAVQAGAYANVAAGLVLLAGLAAVSAMAWSARRGRSGW